MHGSQAARLQQGKQTLYAELWRRAEGGELHAKHTKQIKKDVGRSGLPAEEQEMLRRVLSSYALHNEQVGTPTASVDQPPAWAYLRR